MARKFWRRRNLLVAAGIVALSIGIVFASVPLLPVTPVAHSSLTSPETITVEPGTPSQPNPRVLALPNLVTSENFYLGVSVTNGTASFCVIKDNLYLTWLQSGYSPTSDCIGNTPTLQTAQITLKFLPTSPGTWYVVALNSGSTKITVFFTPA